MRWIYRVGATTLVGAILWSCSSEGPSSSANQTASGRSRPAPARDSSQSSPNIELDSLLTEVPEYEGRGRNLFDYGRPPAPDRPTTPTPAATTTIPAPVQPRPTTPRPSAAPQKPIDLKFAGFVEKPHSEGGDSKKYAVFLSGVEILTGAEGELVANRYKIVEIGLESVTVSVEGSDSTQKIPLRTN
jgi:hypothetical protein